MGELAATTGFMKISLVRKPDSGPAVRVGQLGLARSHSKTTVAFEQAAETQQSCYIARCV